MLLISRLKKLGGVCIYFRDQALVGGLADVGDQLMTPKKTPEKWFDFGHDYQWRIP